MKFVDGLPCFSIEDNELTRRGLVKLVDIQVTGKNGDMWFVSFNTSVTLLPSQCVTYGKPIGNFVEKLPAKTLQPDEQYGVAIGAPMDGYPYEVHFYLANFFWPRSLDENGRMHQFNEFHNNGGIHFQE